MCRINLKIFIILILIVAGKESFFSQNPAVCNSAQNLCTNSLFSFTASSGTGLTPGLNISNPFSNPQAVNNGCMFTNVANPQWLLLNITSSGNLGFSFGAAGSAFPQAGNYDWIMWPYTPTTCNDIFNNTLPPVACNYNCTGTGGTGMGTVPVGGFACNFQPSIPVVQGQQYMILITNPTGVNTNVSFANTGSAGVSCNPLKYPNLTTCPGQLAVFTGTWVNASSGTYTLFPGSIVQTNPSFTVSSLANQVYTVMASGLNSSSAPIADQTTFTLTINPVIPISVTTQTDFCYGSNAAFTINPVGSGTFNVTGPSAPTSSFATTSISIPNITTPNIGTFSITASYTNGCTGTQTTSINVSPNNTVSVSSNTNVCQGGTVNLTASLLTATAYAWSGPNAYTSSSQNPTLNTLLPVSSGIYTVSANNNFNALACPKINTVQVSVVATNPVTVTPSFTLCQGSNLNLTASATGASSYSWSGPGAYTSLVQNPSKSSMLPGDAGNYNVTAMFTNGFITCTTGAVSNVSVVATSTVNITVPANICQNATANLSANATSPLSYSWSGPNAFSSNIASPTIPNIQTNGSGIYTATAMFAIGSVSCTTSSSSSISVVGTNTVAATPNFTVCQGANLPLTSSATSAVSYSWSGPGAYTSAVQNPTINGIVPSGSGNYNVTASFSDGVLTCTTGAVSNVSVVPTSSVSITVPANICQNATANLSASATAPLSYSWTGPNAFTSTSATPSIPNIQTNGSGIYSVTALFAIGSVSCTTSNTAQIAVVGTNTVAITPNFTLCEGSNLNLNSNATSAVSYSWSGPPAYTSAVQNPTITSITATGSGNYSVTALFSNGSLTCATGAVSNVSVVPTSSVSITVPANICQNATANLLASATAPLSYSWTGPNAFTSTSATPSIPNIQTNGSGIYSVTALFAIGSVSCTTSNTAQIAVVGTNTVAITPNFTLCEGSNLNLNSNATSAVSYSWNGPPAYTSAVQNPTITGIAATGSGNYSVTALFSNGSLTCATGAVSNVSVVPTSSVSITVPANICQNATANLLASATAPLSYSWTGPNAFTSTSATPSIPNMQTNGSGIYSVTALFAIGSVSCITSNTAQIAVVGTNTVAVTPNFTLCEGSNLNLTSNATSAVSYSWSGPAGYTASVQNATITGIAAAGSGNYSVTALFSNGSLTCATGAVSNVSVVATPSITVTYPTDVCQNATVNLSATAPGAVSYAWAGPNAFSSTIASPTINNIQAIGAGVYTTTALFSIGTVSCTNTSTNQVNVVATNTVAVAPAFTVCEGASVNLTSNAASAVSYSWNGPGGYTSSVQNPTINAINIAGAGNYTAIAFFSNVSLTCSTTAVSNVSVVATPVVNIIVPANICQNSTANISANAPGAVSYSWSGPNSFSSNSGTTTVPGIQTNGAGIYTSTAVFAIGSVSCANTGTGQISVVAINSITINSVMNGCAGQTNILQANSAGATSYQWAGPGGYSATGSSATLLNTQVNAAGLYTVTTAYTNGFITCNNTATLNLIVNPVISFTLPASVSLCYNSPLTINGPAGASSYTWQNASGAVSSTQNLVIPNLTLANAGTYSLTASIGFCATTQVILVNVASPIQFTAAPSNVTICKGDSTRLQVGSMGGSANYAYVWDPPTSLTSSTGSLQIANPSGTTLYNIYAYDIGCPTYTIAHSFTVTVKQPPVPHLNLEKSVGCEPLCQFYNAQLGSDTKSVTYDFGGFFKVQADSFNYCIQRPGTYNLTLITTGVNGCSARFQVSQPITVYPSPHPSFYHVPDKPTLSDNQVTFYPNFANGPIVYQNWTFAGTGKTDYDSTSATNPIRFYDKVGQYPIMLVGITDKGCVDTVFQLIDVIDDLSIYIPNTFTPNGDGINDIFIAKGIGFSPDDFIMELWNRNGSQIYFSRDYSKGWDGSVKGAQAEVGTYIYKIKVLGTNHEGYKEFTGHVNLIR